MTRDNKHSAIEKELMARTIYGESRGEYYQKNGGLSSLISVANVIMNRVKSKKKWYGTTVQEVCRKPYQFSCWNPRDPNYAIISNVKKGDDKIFDICLHVAEKVLTDQWPDLTGGSINYHSKKMSKFPEWSNGKKYQLEIGNHVFYQ